MTHPILVLRSIPRSVSTSFERMVSERGDHAVFDERFSRAYYFGPDQHSHRYDRTIPHSAVREVMAEIERAAEERPVLVEDMAYQARDVLDSGFLDRVQSSFLVRHPAAALRSLAHSGIEHRPDALTWEPGMRPEWELWSDWHGSTSRSRGFSPLRPVPAPPGPDEPRLRATYDAAMPVYERLRAHALTV